MTRRDALRLVGATIGYLHGHEVLEGSSQVASSDKALRGLALVLDGIDGIILQYRGERVIIRPVELMAAFTGMSPQQYLQIPPPQRGKE